MKTRAAVAFEAKRPLEGVELDLEGSKAGEVWVARNGAGGDQPQLRSHACRIEHPLGRELLVHSQSEGENGHA
jgi:hypothetical protein